MTIDQYVSDFLRDAQFRIAQIGTELDALDDFEAPRYKQIEGYREELYLFMAVLYVGEWSIIDGYNHLDWDEFDIRAEMEYLRNRTGMVTSPFVTFVGNYPEIVESISGGTGGANLPEGTIDDYIGYNANGDAVAIPFPVVAGAIDTDTAITFFT